MSTLHILNHSPFSDNSLSSCLRIVGNNDAILLCGDALYALQPQGGPFKAIEEKRDTLRLFILEEDLVARNFECPEWATCVDYCAFVELSIRYDKVNSWL